MPAIHGPRLAGGRLEHGVAEPKRPTSPQPDEPANASQLEFAIRTHPAVVADFLKPTWQDVLHKAPHERLTLDVTGDGLATARRFDFISHVAFVDLFDATVAQGHSRRQPTRPTD